MLNNLMVFVTPYGGDKIEIDNIIVEMNMQCGLDKPYVILDFTIPYGIYNKNIPSYWLDTATKVEVYDMISGNLKYVGIVDKAKINGKEETLDVTCHDYVYNLIKSKVFYNFKNMSAFDCVKKIFDDLEIPYSTNNGYFDGLLGGAGSDDGNITINHIVKNKSAYEAVMCIATECHMQLGYYYYVYMDVAGNVNITTCDRYYAGQTIKSGPDGNLLDCSYSKDSSDIVTKIICYTSEGDEEDLEGTSSSSGSNGKTIGIDMGHNKKCPGASGILDEVDENRKIGNKLISLLSNGGYTVVSCTDDTTENANSQLGGITSKANAQNLDLFISIHLNAGGGNGTEIYYNSKANVSIANAICKSVAESCGFNNRGSSQHDYYVLRNNNNPALLLEVCFVDSQTDANKLNTDSVANAIYEAIKQNV